MKSYIIAELKTNGEVLTYLTKKFGGVSVFHTPKQLERLIRKPQLFSEVDIKGILSDLGTAPLGRTYKAIEHTQTKFYKL